MQVRQLERTVGLRDLSIVEMEAKMREMSAATYDGVFVWKISDFSKKRQDAVAGRAPAMFSPGSFILYIFLHGFILIITNIVRDFRSKSFDMNIVTYGVSFQGSLLCFTAFYTSKYGYKMCLRIYLNGDGTGRGTHLSLFFVVMRGHSDALLKWPFNQKVSLISL